MSDFYLNLRRSLGFEPPDTPLIILRLSFSAVKGNLNHGSRGTGRWSGSKRLMPRGMEARRRRKPRARAPAKKFAVFAFAQTRFPLGQVSCFRTG